MRLDVCLVLPLLTVSLSFLGDCAQGSEAPQERTSQLTREMIIKGIENNFEHLQKIHTLSISYKLTYANLAGRRNYAFDEVRASNISQGDMLYTEINATAKGDNPQSLHRISTWNTRFGVQRNSDFDLSIMTAPGNLIHYYRYYFTFMCLPIGSARANGGSKSTIAAGGDYWIPDALVRFAGDFRVASAAVEEGGSQCYLLERPGRDRLWVDPAKNFSILRRDFFYPDGRRLWERTIYREFKEVGGHWFPTFLQREEFGGPGDPIGLENKVCHRKVIDQVEISTKTVSDDTFFCKIREGDYVNDTARGISYRALKEDDHQIEQTLDGLRQGNPTSRRVILLVIGNVLLLMLFILIIFMRRASSSKGQTNPRPDLPDSGKTRRSVE